MPEVHCLLSWAPMQRQDWRVCLKRMQTFDQSVWASVQSVDSRTGISLCQSPPLCVYPSSSHEKKTLAFFSRGLCSFFRAVKNARCFLAISEICVSCVFSTKKIPKYFSKTNFQKFASHSFTATLLLFENFCFLKFGVVAAFYRFGEVCRVLETACQKAGLSSWRATCAASLPLSRSSSDALARRSGGLGSQTSAPRWRHVPLTVPPQPGLGGDFLINFSRWCSFGKTRRHCTITMSVRDLWSKKAL